MGNILIIDDEPNIRLMIRRILESDGHTITEAADGGAGIKCYQKNPFDLIIADLIMPDKEGLETINELKKEYPDIKIVAISGGGKTGPGSHLQTARLLGAAAILEKPFKKEMLLQTIRELMR